MFQRLCLLVVGLASLAAVGHADGDAATALATSIQRHYDRVRDFQADFTHTYVGGILRKKTVERGRMAVRKPGRMRNHGHYEGEDKGEPEGRPEDRAS